MLLTIEPHDNFLEFNFSPVDACNIHALTNTFPFLHVFAWDEKISAVRRLLTFNTKQGLCSVGVDFDDLCSGRELAAVKERPAMRGVPHYEVKKRETFMKTASVPAMTPKFQVGSRIPLRVRNGSKSFDSFASLPVSVSDNRLNGRLRKQRKIDTCDSALLSPSTDSGCMETSHSFDDFTSPMD